MQVPPLDPAQFPVAERYRCWNHAGIAPLPQVAADAFTAYADDAARRGSAAYEAWDLRAEQVRERAGLLLGTSGEDVAFVKNTTEGLSFVAGGLSWEPGDRVLVPDLEFPSTLYPWLALADRGVTVDLVQPVGETRALPLEVFEEALRARPTRLVCTSWVQFGRGWRTDLAGLAALCHEHGALLCVDVIQGLGVLPCALSDWGVDFAAADAHKWMLGPQGIGVLYVAEHRRDLLRPLEPGWASVADRDDFESLVLEWAPSARRFEGGSIDLGAVAAMGASIDLLLDAGVDAVWRHVNDLCEQLCEQLRSSGATVHSDRAEGASGIVTFGFDDLDPTELATALDERGVLCAARGGGVRLSPHGWMPTEEIDAVMSLIAEAASTPRR